MIPVLLVWLSVIAAAPALHAPVAQTPPAPPPSVSEAYLQFMLGRRLEATGDVDGAIAALLRAAELDPRSAEIRAELAGLYARQDRPKDALDWGDAALKLESNNREAHRVLGLIDAALAERPNTARRLGLADVDAATLRARAVEHLERADRDGIVDPSLHLTLGRAYVRQGSYAKAVLILRRTLDEDMGPSEASLLLAEAYAATGQTADARRTLERALTDEPDFLRARLQLAELDEREGRFADAADEYGRALAGNPGHPDLTRRQAAALLRAGQPARARDVLQPLVSGSRAGASELYLLFQAERDLNDLDAAEATARRLMQAAAEDVRGPFALAQVLERRRDYKGIVEMLEPLVKRFRLNDQAARQIGPLITQLAFAYQELHDYDRAIQTFEALQALAPDDPAGAVYLVQAHLVAGHLDQAITLARRSRERFADDVRLVELEADALRRQGRIDAGVALLRDTLRTRETASLYVSLSELCVAGKRFGEAEEALARARNKFPDDESVTFQLGVVYDRANRAAEAERVFRAILTRDPLNAPALNYLGYMFAERGRALEEAVTLISRALDRDPGNPAYLDSLGWAYFKLGKLDLAERHLRHAAGDLITNSVVQDHLGDLLFRLKRFTEAIATWQRALDGDGESIERATIEAKIRDARAKAGRR
jgi:tetratricopeptide (TPR) repeat protein